MKLIKTIFMGLIIVLVVIVAARNVVAKIAVEKGVTVATGLPLHIDKFNVGFKNTLVDIEGFRLSNPKGFEDKTMASIPKIYVDYHLGDILSGNIHLEAVKLHLEEFVVIKNTDGTLNLDALKPVQDSKPKKDKLKESKEKKPAPEIQIDLLELKIGKVVYKDYSKGDKPSVKEFKINISEQYRDVTKIESLVKIIVVKALSNSTLASLTNFDLGGLQSSIGDTLANSTKLVDNLAGKAGQEIGKVTGEALKATGGAEKLLKSAVKDASMKATTDKAKSLLGGTTKEAGELAGKTTDTAKKLTGSLFGKLKEVTE